MRGQGFALQGALRFGIPLQILGTEPDFGRVVPASILQWYRQKVLTGP